MTAVAVDTRVDMAQAAAAAPDTLLAQLTTSAEGLSAAEAAARRTRFGPNALPTHTVSAWAVLKRQLGNAVLLLLAGTAILSAFLGDVTQSIIIGIILVISVGLGFINEYRAERATQALHSRVQHSAVARRDGQYVKLDVTDLVPGDVIRLTLGEAVPADVRLLEVQGLECNEGLLTGESAAAVKSAEPVPPGTALAECSDLAFMGTIVSSGEGTAVVYATGSGAEFGKIAAGLGTTPPETNFQAGLRKFSYLLLYVAITLTVLILVTNLLLRRPIIESVLFALAIAVGITPQLLPAVVSSSLAAGSRQLAKRKVLVKRLVCIEDLGDIDVLITDKTGTLTEGHISFVDAVDPAGTASADVLRLGLLATDVDPATGGASGNDMDAALWESHPDARNLTAGVTKVAELPFDHTRRASSVLIDETSGGTRTLVLKGAPEQVLDDCVDAPATTRPTLDALFADGRRVVAVATRSASALTAITAADEQGLTLAGFLVFADNPKAAAKDSLAKLAELEIDVKVATGDNPQVAEKVCKDLGLTSKGAVTGTDIERLSGSDFDEMVANTTIFARVTPEQKAAIIRSARKQGRSVGYLGDGVNDAPALKAAHIGIAMGARGTDVAREAAALVLLALQRIFALLG